MGKKRSYEDVVDRADKGTSLAHGQLWVTENGVAVLLVGRKSIGAVKGSSLLWRHFHKPISDSWLQRRINEFGEHVKATKLPRGPRRQIDKDIAEIAKPIKRIRKSGKASKEFA